MEIFIDFGGFYGFHEEYIDNRIEMFDINEDNINWRETLIDYSKNWLYRFNNETDLNLEFVELYSPDFYNYTTDKIVAKLNELDILNLQKYIIDKSFIDYVDDKCKSYDGYISFYDGYDDLVEKGKDNEEEKEYLYSLLMDWLIDEFEVNDCVYELEYDIIQLK
jgi:hypothetical protein